MTNSKCSMLIDGEKLFADLEKETSYEKYCIQQIEKTGESPSIVDYIKYLEGEVKSFGTLRMYGYPTQSIIKILDVQRTPKRKTIKSIVIETENFYRRIEKNSDFTNMNFNWEELKELANQSTTP